ncbi:multiple sugar transport system permease protein [Microbacterium keratanolyticum]|uniref:ABC transporter permease n=1 Tax=Microbacterium keratanolyticum TaxID=67574 RepID=A0A9W6HQL5_9MICO|nr:sugar ABC transporter permease [Microbacterium keratanolyticum]MBM7469027.1 multiple sugar transport system permease protein [Microbacterium keratanolyticum]GLK01106.1 ABC transporter permease [Microbacterium keratanolyticum]
MTDTTLTRTPSRAKRGRGWRDSLAAYGFLAPWIIGMLAFTIGPVIASFFLSFTQYNLLQPPTWIGTKNYEMMLQDERLHHSIGVTFTYVAVAVPLQLIVALALAMLLDRGMRGMSFYRSAFYLPSMLGASVAIAVLWRQMFGADGLVNQVLAMFGVEGASWIASPDTALGTLILLHIWTFGSPLVIFLAGLRNIPRMYYEAAQVDGAGPLRRFGAITLPLLSPIIFFNLVLQIIGAFQTFTQAFVVSNGTGGPSDATLFFTLYLYQKGFPGFQMGYASAMAWLLLLIVAAVTALNFWISKWWVFYED